MHIRNKWVEFYLPSDYKHWCFHVGLPSDSVETYPRDNYRIRLTIGFWKLFLAVYLWKVKPFKGAYNLDNYRTYGITFFERGVHVHWNKTKVYDLPWAWDIVRHDLLLPSGDVYWRNKFPDYNLGVKIRDSKYWYEIQGTPEESKVSEYCDIVHHTKDGRRQVARIRLNGDEREWRWKWFRWLPWPNKKQRVVDCNSNVELGKKAGSWKGGLMGWSCEWKKGESMKSAFYRWYSNWNGE
jgi:hypothetical protein